MKKFLFAAAVCLTVLGAAIACKGLAGSAKGPCDIYAKGGTPCVTAHSTTRQLYSKYNGPLYQVVRESDGATLDIYAKHNGIADAAAQDAFCKGAVCYISVIYDQSGLGNDCCPPLPEPSWARTRATSTQVPSQIWLPPCLTGRRSTAHS